MTNKTNMNVLYNDRLGTKERFKKLTFNEMAFWMAEHHPDMLDEFEKNSKKKVYKKIKQQQFNNDGTPKMRVNPRTGKPEFVYVTIEDMNNPEEKFNIAMAKKWFCEKYFPELIQKEKKETMADILAMARAKAQQTLVVPCQAQEVIVMA